MDPILLSGLIALGVLVGLLILYCLFYLFIFLLACSTFWERRDKRPGVKYFTAEDFDDLEAGAVTLGSKKHKLRGYVYTAKNQAKDEDNLIIFFHGWGAGHLAYTKEIRTLALKTGYKVLAVDYAGNDLSDGRNRGFLNALKNSKQIIDFAVKTYPNRRIHIVGHSMGGFVAGNALSYAANDAVKTVTVISGLNSLPLTIGSLLKANKFVQKLINIAYLIAHPRLGRLTTAKSIANNKVPTLVIHGKLDQSVSYKTAGRVYQEVARTNKHIRTIMYNDKYHNPYLTLDAEAAYNEFINNLRLLSGKKNAQKRAEYLATVDYERLGKDDPEIFEVINSLVKDE